MTRLEYADNCIIIDDVIYPKGLLRACIEKGKLTVWEDLERTIPLVNSVSYEEILYVNAGETFANEAELLEFVKTHFFLQMSGGGSGSVISVGISSTDLSVSGSPVTSSGSITLNVNNDAITYAKMQNMASGKLLGRYSPGSGNIQELTISSGLDLDSSGNLTVTGGPIKIDSGSYTPTITNVSGVDVASSSVIGNFFWKQTGAIVDIDGYIETIALSSPPEVASRIFRLSPHDILTFNNATDATGFGVTNIINSVDRAGAFIEANPTNNDLLVSFSSDAADSRLFKVHATYILDTALTTPMFISGVISDSNKNRITLTANKTLNSALTATNSSFTVIGSVGTFTVTGRNITGNLLHIDVDSDFIHGEDIEISYTAGTDALEDIDGLAIANFSAIEITNNIASTDTLLTSGRFIMYDFQEGSGQYIYNLDGGNTSNSNLLPIGTRKPDGVSNFDDVGISAGWGVTAVTTEYADDDNGNPVATRIQLGAGGNNTGAAVGTGTWPSSGIQYNLPAGTYTLSIKAKSTSGSDQEFRLAAPLHNFTSDLIATSSWQTFSHTFTSIGGNTRVMFACNGTGEAATDILISEMNLVSGSSPINYMAPAYDGVLGSSGLAEESTDPVWISEGLDFEGKKKVKTYIDDVKTGVDEMSLHMVLKLNAGSTQQGWVIAAGEYPYDFSFKAGNTSLSHQPTFKFGDYAIASASTVGLADGQTHLVSCIYDGTNSHIYVDSMFVSVSGSPSPGENISVKEILIGGIEAISSNTSFDGEIYHLTAYDVAHTEAEIEQQFNALKVEMATRSITLNKIDVLVQFDGDSLSAEPNINYARVSIGEQAIPTQGRTFAKIGAQVGEAIAPDVNTLQYRAEDVDATYDAIRSKNILNVFIGANDLVSLDATTFVARLKAYCLNRKATGWTVILCTVLPNTAIDLTERAAANSAIVSDTSFYDFRVDWHLEDFGLDGAELNTDWYHDGVHATEALQILMGEAHAPVLTAALA